MKLPAYLLLALILNILEARAEEITVEFSAEVDYVGLPLLVAFQKSQRITGSYVFDSSARDLLRSGSAGLYQIKELAFTSDGVSGQSQATDVRSGLLILPSERMHIYKVQAYGDIAGSSIDGYVPFGIRLLLVFPPTTFEDDTLPGPLPSLLQSKSAELELIFKKGRSFASVHAVVTALRARY